MRSYCERRKKKTKEGKDGLKFFLKIFKKELYSVADQILWDTFSNETFLDVCNHTNRLMYPGYLTDSSNITAVSQSAAVL